VVDTELAPLPPEERREILLEIRSHVLEPSRRTPRRTEDVLADLGPPREYARQYLRNPEVGPQDAGVFRRIFALTAGGPRSFPLLIAIVTSYGVAALLFWAGVLDLVVPDSVSVWVSGEGRPERKLHFVIGRFTGDGRELFRRTLAPLLLLLALLIHLALSRLLRRLVHDGRSAG
jgi:hypothetical protein